MNSEHAFRSHKEPEHVVREIGDGDDVRGPDLIDLNDPALPYIYDAAKQLIEFGYDPNDPDVAMRAIKVGRRMMKESPEARAERLGLGGAPVRGRFRDHLFTEGQTVVYYMRIGNRVKIGWTKNLKGRLSNINPEELMATEPGGRDQEIMRHTQFWGLRTQGEWFLLEEPLTSHIEALRRAAREAS